VFPFRLIDYFSIISHQKIEINNNYDYYYEFLIVVTNIAPTTNKTESGTSTLRTHAALDYLAPRINSVSRR
jgi:hypothetical protein